MQNISTDDGRFLSAGLILPRFEVFCVMILSVCPHVSVRPVTQHHVNDADSWTIENKFRTGLEINCADAWSWRVGVTEPRASLYTMTENLEITFGLQTVWTKALSAQFIHAVAHRSVPASC